MFSFSIFKNRQQTDNELTGDAETSLMRILNHQIETYLTIDMSWLKGKKGEDRANDYKESLRLLSLSNDVSDIDILKKVISDVKSTHGFGVLGTSTDLRRRLIDGICIHLNIQQDEIDRKAAKSIPPVVHDVAFYKHLTEVLTFKAIDDAMAKNYGESPRPSRKSK